MGREKADVVIKRGVLINVYTGELIENVDIAIKEGRIALVGDAGHTIGNETKIIDAKDTYMAPGFIDAHVHIESSMLTATGYAEAVVPKGTTTVFADPHEIANVLGLEGVKLILKEAETLPLKVFVCMPSCVPAAPGFETAGAEIGPREIREALTWEGVVALGEMMNYPGVIMCDDEVHDEISVTLKLGKPVEGHSNGLLGRELSAYVSAGITSCHEATGIQEGIERLRAGMHLMVREGSAWKDLKEVIKVVTNQKLNPRRVVLVTDDRHPADLMEEGHVNHVVKRAIEEGVDPITAIQMATLNPAEHYRMSHEIGGIAPGRCADIILLTDLERVEVSKVISDGVLVAENGKLIVKIKKPEYPEKVKRTVKLKRPLKPEDFAIKAPIESGYVKARVIGVKEYSVLTKHLIEKVKVENWSVKLNSEDRIAKVAVIERHKLTGNMALGLVKGFDLKFGAVASTIAHDSHNMLVVGLNDRDMAKAVNSLAEMNGGLIAVKNEEIIGSLSLPIAGLMSDEPVNIVCEKLSKLKEAWKLLGCKMESPFMTMSLLSLAVLPELRITDKGLVDTVEFKFVDLFLN